MITKRFSFLACTHPIFNMLGHVPLYPGGFPTFIPVILRLAHFRMYLYIQDFREKMTFKKLVVEEYIGDVNRNMAPALKSENPTQLQATYNIAGNLCKHCAPLLYVQVLTQVLS